jgi:hypothetical protein
MQHARHYRIMKLRILDFIRDLSTNNGVDVGRSTRLVGMLEYQQDVGMRKTTFLKLNDIYESDGPAKHHILC